MAPDPSSPPENLLDLPPEIISHIISFLRRPAPRSNSGAPRNAIQQGDLATCMRVNVRTEDQADDPQDFNTAAAPFLYRTVCTDNLALVLRGHETPTAHPGVEAKTTLLGRVKRLMWDYSDPYRESTYEELLQSGQPGYMSPDANYNCVGHLGRVHPAARKPFSSVSMVRHMASQLIAIDWWLRLESDQIAITSTSRLTKLETIALGSLYESHETEWGLWNRHQDNHRMIMGMQNTIERCLRSPLVFPKLAHVCVRPNSGPLSPRAQLPKDPQVVSSHLQNWYSVRSHIVHPDIVPYLASNSSVTWTTEAVTPTLTQSQTSTTDDTPRAGSPQDLPAAFIRTFRSSILEGWRNMHDFLTPEPRLLQIMQDSRPRVDWYISNWHTADGAPSSIERQEAFIAQAQADLDRSMGPSTKLCHLKLRRAGTEPACPACDTLPAPWQGESYISSL